MWVRAAYKPGSVLDRGRGVTIHLGRVSPHASRNLPERSARKRGRIRRCRRSYSVLLPVGFAVPSPLPAPRCALAAPFHPCPQSDRPESRRSRRAVCSLLHFPWGRPRRVLPGTVLPWSPDFPPPTRRVAPTGRGRSPVRHAPEPHVGPGAAPGKPGAGASRRTAAIRPIVSWSSRPSIRSGRQWRWKAAIARVGPVPPRSAR